MRLADQLFEGAEHPAGHSDLSEVAHASGAGTIENPQHHTLAMQRGRDGHAEIELPIRETQADTAVLRDAPLRDVQVRHDLDATDHGRLVLPRRARDVVQHSVDPVAHPQPVRSGLQVDVARARAQCFENHDVDELDDGRLTGEGAQVVERLVFLSEQLEVGATQVGGNGIGRRSRGFDRQDGGLQFCGRRRDDADAAPVGPA